MPFNQPQKRNILPKGLKKISVGKKALIYVLSMGAIGAVVGTIDSKIVLEQCSNAESCAIANSAKIQLGKISMGTCAGMVAATLLSIPAILKEEN